MTVTPEVGKFYKIRSGMKAAVSGILRNSKGNRFYGHIIQTESSSDLIIDWDICGSRFGYECNGNSLYDLIEEWKEPRSGVAYANVYGDVDMSMPYATRETADRGMSKERTRLACIRIPWTEGQFDD